MMEAMKQIIIGPRSPLALRYAKYLSEVGGRTVTLVALSPLPKTEDGDRPFHLSAEQFASDTSRAGDVCLVLFDVRHCCDDETLMQGVEEHLRRNPGALLFLISSASIHSGDLRCSRAETKLHDRFGPLASRLVTLRVTHQVGPETLASVIDAETHSARGRRSRTFTLLEPTVGVRSPNPLEALSSDPNDIETTRSRGTSGASGFRSLGKLLPRPGASMPETLRPNSVSELLTLYHPYSYQHVQIAGCNTGVKHFGWEFPGKTLIQTIRTARRARVRGDRLDVDAGLTLKLAIECLRRVEKEFYVVPNYSYISMGTIFFVPVHGSGSDVSTLGETIEKALLYLPDEDRFLRIKRGDPNFGRYIYRPESKALVLRLTFRIRDQTRYFVKQSTHATPRAREIVDHFSDPEAVNVEISKSKAADDCVTIRKYYEHDQIASGKPLELPKDSLGRLWDRLEETPVVSHLFHEYVRRFGYHVELFLSKTQFDRFWKAHRELPLRKIQLRRMKQDGLPHSPCSDCDRISADLFMKRSDKDRFLAFIEHHLPDVHFNPGKHSR